MKTNIIAAFVMCGLFMGNYGDNCEQNNPISNGIVPFPKTNNMTMAVFDSKVVNKSMGVVEVALPIPPPFTPSYNFNCKIVKTNATLYQRTCTSQKTTQCKIYQISITPWATGDAIFTYEYNGNKRMEAYWSKNPDEYIWKIRCLSEFSSSYACPLNNVILGLYVVNKDQYNNAMKIRSMNDLNDTICVVYESNPEKLKWYTYNLTEPCEV